jgi:hypothetical protein
MRPCRLVRAGWLLAAVSVSFALLTMSAAQATPAPSSFETSYNAKLYGFNIAATSRLSPLPNGNYEYYFNADSIVGKVTEMTEVSWNAKEQRIIPQRYIYQRNGMGKNRDDELVFDWSANKVTNVKNAQSQVLDAAKNIQDSLSYQIQLSQDLIAGKKQFEYSIANGRKIKQYKFEIVGEEVLTTPLGDVKTVKVKRTRDKSELVTYAWFAKDFQYLLVRLQQEENGSAYTIYISKASLNGKAIEHF